MGKRGVGKPVHFDEIKRREYVWGFQKRKEERRRIAMDEKDKKAKDERKQIKADALKKLETAYEDARTAHANALKSFDKFEKEIYKRKGIKGPRTGLSDELAVNDLIAAKKEEDAKKEQIEFKNEPVSDDDSDDGFGGVVVTISNKLPGQVSSDEESEEESEDEEAQQ